MKKHLVFFHQNYPAQFGPIIRYLMNDPNIKVSFFSEYKTKNPEKGINHFIYKRDNTNKFNNPFFFSRYFEEETRSMYGAYKAFEAAKLGNVDCIIGHVGFGNLMLFHVAYPDIPSIGFFELFYDPFSPETYTRPDFEVPLENILRMPLRNATQILELEYCHKGYSPTPYQGSTYPKAYQPKIKILFDGIDTEKYKPGSASSNSDLKRTWPDNAKIITYTARGLESFRGFDIFMEIAHQISRYRKDVHFVIAGKAKTYYGPEMMKLKESSFKEYVLKKRPFDLSRFHFLDWISESALVDLYRLSDCHVYWTIPFTLSWSLFQALSSGAIVLASKTAPVLDVIIDQQNGLLVDPYNIEAFVDKVLDIVSFPEQYGHLKQKARQTVLKSYSLEVCLPKLKEFYLSD